MVHLLYSLLVLLVTMLVTTMGLHFYLTLLCSYSHNILRGLTMTHHISRGLTIIPHISRCLTTIPHSSTSLTTTRHILRGLTTTPHISRELTILQVWPLPPTPTPPISRELAIPPVWPMPPPPTSTSLTITCITSDMHTKPSIYGAGNLYDVTSLHHHHWSATSQCL